MSSIWRQTSDAGVALSHGDRDSAHGRRKLQADLYAVQFENDAPGVLQHDASSAARNGCARSERTIGAGEITGRLQIPRAPDQLHGRCADGRPKTHAGDHEGIVVTSEGQDTLPAADAHNKSSLG